MYSTQHRPSGRQDFQGTDRLKFTVAEQHAIRAAEQAEGYETQRPAVFSSLFDLVGEQLVIAVVGAADFVLRMMLLSLAFAFLLGVVVAFIQVAPSPSSNERTEAQRAQAQAQPQPPGNAPATQSEFRIEGRNPDTPAQRDIGALPESEPPAGSQAENVAKAEIVRLREPARYEGRWTAIEAERETLLFEDPRFDSSVLRRIASRSHYYALDTHRECGGAEGLTWKLAVVELPTVEFFQGFVCTPEQRSGAERK